MGQIGQTDKVRLRSGSRVSRSIILRPNRSAMVVVKTAVPVVSLLSSLEVVVNHADLIGKEWGASIRLQDQTTQEWHDFVLERSPPMEAAASRVSHYVDMLFTFALGLGVLVGLGILLGYVMDYVGIPLLRGVSGVASDISTSVANSRLLSVLLAIGLLAAIVVLVGFLLAIGWRIAGRVFKR